MSVMCAVITNTHALHRPAHMEELWARQAVTWRVPDWQVCAIKVLLDLSCMQLRLCMSAGTVVILYAI